MSSRGARHEQRSARPTRWRVMAMAAMVALIPMACGGGASDAQGPGGNEASGAEQNGSNGNGSQSGTRSGDQSGGMSGGMASDNPRNQLPPLSSFIDAPSDQFLVDYDVITSGHPYLGVRSVQPHTGGHVHFDGMETQWPKGGTAPDNYPPIYAVADGVIDHIEKSYRNGANARYGIYLAIAHDGDITWDFEYSIEPMVPEPSPGFYATFIKVNEGDIVHKGDIIGYMYLPAESQGRHIHFELMSTPNSTFAAPAIFSRDVLDAFFAHWGEFGYERTGDTQTPIGECLGWMLGAEENPFGTGAVDCL